MQSNFLDSVGPHSTVVHSQTLAGRDAEIRRLLALLNKSEDFVRGFDVRSDSYFSFIDNNGELLIRHLREGDESGLEDFGNALGPSSRQLFAPSLGRIKSLSVALLGPL